MQSGDHVRAYVLEETIGVGAMGEVWRARHQSLQRNVAIKIIQEQVSVNAEFRERFMQEAQAMARLQHPNIVPVHDFFTVDHRAFLVMSLIDGGSLAESGRLAPDVALTISRELLDALNCAHQQGVIHRDVKPSNILLDQRGHAYMTDFGIALIAGTQRMTRLSRTGTAVGTPEYMSPEQIATPQDVDHRTDVYSFGCVLYEMLSGTPPFGSREDGTSEFELMQSHVTRQPIPLHQRHVQVNRGTESAVMRALAKDREDRFAGCGEMAQALFREWRYPFQQALGRWREETLRQAPGHSAADSRRRREERPASQEPIVVTSPPLAHPGGGKNSAWTLQWPSSSAKRPVDSIRRWRDVIWWLLNSFLAPSLSNQVSTGLVDVRGILQIEPGSVRLIPQDGSLSPMPLRVAINSDIRDGDSVHVVGTWEQRRFVRVVYLRNRTTRVTFVRGFGGLHAARKDPRTQMGNITLRGVIQVTATQILITPVDDVIPQMPLRVKNRTAAQLKDGDVVHVYGDRTPNYLGVFELRNIRSNMLIRSSIFGVSVRPYSR